MTKALNVYGEQAAAAAIDMFDDVMAAEGLSVRGSMPSGLITADEVSRIGHYQAGKLRTDDRDGFARMIEESTHFLVRQVANRAMWWQGGLYGSGSFEDEIFAMAQQGGWYEIRYARVPQGIETCDFCLMLASRGFVYLTEDTASAHVHRNCDCIVVPGVGHYESNNLRYSKGNWMQDTQIEGYDIGAMKRLYPVWQDISKRNLPPDEKHALKLQAMREEIGRTEW